MHGPVQIDINPSHTVARINVPLNGSGSDDVSGAALHELRDSIIPATIATIPAAEYGVTGTTAASFDFNHAMKRSVPIVFGFVLTFAFLLLLVTFRSS
jgi:RND superfamily putative drug exporter